MNIRKATLKDCPALEQINVLAQKETGWWIPQNAQFYKKFLKKNNNDLLVAYKANNLIGFLSLEYNKEQKSTWINDVFVIPSSRKKGIAILDITEDLAVEKPVSDFTYLTYDDMMLFLDQCKY